MGKTISVTLYTVTDLYTQSGGDYVIKTYWES